MANFPTHAATGAFVGFAYGLAAHTVWEVTLPAAVLSGGLCAVAALLPDVDSDNAVILRELLAFVAAIIPMLLLDRFRELQLPQETIVAITGLMYVIIRFGCGGIVRRTTVHRGMWHSIPAAALASFVIYFICACPDLKPRLVKAIAVAVGYLWHLLLDEFWSVERAGASIRVKRSFGTALKFFGKRPGPNILVYGALLGMVALMIRKPQVDPWIGGPNSSGHEHTQSQQGNSNGWFQTPAGPTYSAPDSQFGYPRQQMTPTPQRALPTHGQQGPVYQPPR